MEVRHDGRASNVPKIVILRRNSGKALRIGPVPMNQDTIFQYITGTFDDVQTATVGGDTFFFHGADRQMPFVTLVTSDAHDSASDLNRPDVFRLNIGVTRETYRSLFGPQPSFPTGGGIIETGHDFTVLDQLLPHPVYAAMSWVCILNPGERTFRETIQPLLAEAYGLAAGRSRLGAE